MKNEMPLIKKKEKDKKSNKYRIFYTWGKSLNKNYVDDFLEKCNKEVNEKKICNFIKSKKFRNKCEKNILDNCADSLAQEKTKWQGRAIEISKKRKF